MSLLTFMIDVIVRVMYIYIVTKINTLLTELYQ